jgi:hypothetical protein
MSGSSATLRRSMFSIAAAVGAGTLLAVVRTPGRDGPIELAGFGGGPQDEAYEGPEGSRRDPYDLRT